MLRHACRTLALLAEADRSASLQGRTQQFPVRLPASRPLLQRLSRCLAARRPVISAVAGAHGAADGLKAATVKQAAYRQARGAWAGPADAACLIHPCSQWPLRCLIERVPSCCAPARRRYLAEHGAECRASLPAPEETPANVAEIHAALVRR